MSQGQNERSWVLRDAANLCQRLLLIEHGEIGLDANSNDELVQEILQLYEQMSQLGQKLPELYTKLIKLNNKYHKKQ